MRRGSVVLITGASSGLGRATAELLARRGLRVFGTSRRAREGSEAGASPGLYTMLRLDIREDDSVAACVDRVLRQAGRIDALVANAGYALAGAVEETSIHEALAQLETNFLGAVRVIRAVLPTLRGQGGGRIVAISSLGGQVGVPFHAHYCASKFALEGLCEGLRQEVRGFGVHVSLIQPGDFRSEITAHRRRAGARLPAYTPERDRAIEIMARSEERGPDPSRVAACVWRVLASGRPRLRYRVGRDALWVPRLRALLPAPVFEHALRRNFGIGRQG